MPIADDPVQSDFLAKLAGSGRLQKKFEEKTRLQEAVMNELMQRLEPVKGDLREEMDFELELANSKKKKKKQRKKLIKKRPKEKQKQRKQQQ